MIAVVDYGVGNLYSLTGSLKYLGLETVVTSSPDDLERADKIILPGVGAFGDAARKLRESGVTDALYKQVALKKPLLGICLGMQLLFEGSTEYGYTQGLSLIPGMVREIPQDKIAPLKVPHMGWNSLVFKAESPVFKYVSEGERVYYVHSYYAADCAQYVTATSQYGMEITGAVQKDNVFGTQFHPEKSSDTGLRILKAFAEL